MRLAVVGSRYFSDYQWLRYCLLSYFRLEDIEAIISGGTHGADALAERFAREYGIPLRVFPADWARHGRRAGPLRNTEIVRNADAVAAFWDGSSSGTRDTVTKARTAGLYVAEFPLVPLESS